MTVGERIRTTRKKRGLTQKALGELCQMPDSQIRQYELGMVNPKLEQIQRIASALNVPVSVLIDEPTEAQRLQSTWEWIQDNDRKREKLIAEILKTHNYTIKEKDIHWLIVTDFQGFCFYVNRHDFQEMALRCDRDIIYNIEKLLNDSKRKN